MQNAVSDGESEEEEDNDAEEDDHDEDNDTGEGAWIGASVSKHFEGYGVFDGEVIGSRKVKDRYVYKVKYSDGDIEAYEEEELLTLLVQ